MKILVIILATLVLLPATHAASQLNASPGDGLAGGGTNDLPALTNSALPELAKGEEFLHGLKQSGHLPGVPQDSHGKINAYLPLSEAQEAKYPFTVTFDLILEGDSMTNHYTVTQPEQDAEWRLDKAWRTDTRGHLFVEWPVK